MFKCLLDSLVCFLILVSLLVIYEFSFILFSEEMDLNFFI